MTVRRFTSLFVVAIVFLFVQSASAATINPRPLTTPRKRSVKENPHARRHMRHLATGNEADADFAPAGIEAEEIDQPSPHQVFDHGIGR